MGEVIEIFGKRLKIVQDNDTSDDFCKKCAIMCICWNTMNGIPFCRNAKGKINRHFEEVND